VSLEVASVPSLEQIADSLRPVFEVAVASPFAQEEPRVANLIPMPSRPARTGAKPVRVAIRTDRKILFLDAAEILALEAEGNYVQVRHFKTSYMLRERISELAERLQPYGFIRIHRSVLVNGAHVHSIEPQPTGGGRVHLRGGSSYAVGRSYKANLLRIAELWVGV